MILAEPSVNQVRILGLRGPDGQSARQQGCNPVIGTQTSYCRDVLAMEAVSSPIFLDD